MSLRELITHSRGLPGSPDSPVFAEPWQAEAFAMVVALHDRGLFTWEEWAATLSGKLKHVRALDDGSDYYHCWLEALESLIASKNVADSHDIDQLTEAWQRAAHATPHGQPIRLENDPDRS
ncbi:nitrile hydratase accessory protein [Phyllobacterium sp. 1468]|uniref:nitrile hydratase accessory protein n=1 Tax=Phyllobacterium sp. 1468 TaxID=2817759 RepID=UPI00285E0B7B|nr:nitrile hydratase accessory protein [Phyllobacterium sp. 1468]MDR6632955.1 nitrile hydratase accessory protein [Phyllobacterium sp. 1468]